MLDVRVIKCRGVLVVLALADVLRRELAHLRDDALDSRLHSVRGVDIVPKHGVDRDSAAKSLRIGKLLFVLPFENVE
jgi:hypothetical protein